MITIRNPLPCWSRFCEESVKIGTHGQNYTSNKMRPKATSGLTLYSSNKAIYVIVFLIKCVHLGYEMKALAL